MPVQSLPLPGHLLVPLVLPGTEGGGVYLFPVLPMLITSLGDETLFLSPSLRGNLTILATVDLVL